MINFDSYYDPPEYDETCEMCGLQPDDCICPECPECGEYGNPDCYKEGGHGLVYTMKQMHSRNQTEIYYAMEAYYENLMFNDLYN